MKKVFFLLPSLLLVGFLVLMPARGQAASASFNMNFVVADDLFVDFSSMSANGIQDFLNSQPGILKTFTINGRTAARIIFEAAQKYRINPKVLITTLQKEEGLITLSSPSQTRIDWAMGYSVCDSCNGTGDASYRGFDVQVDAAAKAFRKYLDNIENGRIYCLTHTCVYPSGNTGYGPGPWGPDIPSNIQCIQSDYGDPNNPDGRKLCAPWTTITITPANNSTAALYTYTPHPGGNYAFWYLWNFTFQFNVRRIYPDGSLLRAQGSPDVWLIQNGQKRRFANSAAFLARYSFSRVIAVPAENLLVYETGQQISYANYSLLSSPAGGVYLLANDTRRPIQSRQAFVQNGFHWAEVVKVSWAVLNQFPDGDPVTTDNLYPSGRLMQNKITGGIFYVKDGTRHAIMSKAILRSQFGAQKSYPVSPADLDKFTNGLPVGFKDGEIVTSTSGGTAYFISNGYRLPIASWQAAIAYKFDRIWGNLLVVDDKSLAVHPLGPVLDVDVARVASASQ